MLLSFTPPATFRSSKRRRQSGKSKCEFLLLGDSDDHNDISEKDEDNDDDDDDDDGDDDDDEYEGDISDLERLNDDGDDDEGGDEDSNSRSSSSSSSEDGNDGDDDDGGSFSKRHKSLPPPHREYHHEIIMQLSILTPLVGVRLEFLQMKLPFMPSTKYMSDLCLTPPGFSSPLPFFLDKAIHLTVRGWGCENCYMKNDDCEFGLFMPDETAVSEIKVAFHVLKMSGTFVPHEKTREVSVQNMCGSCIAPYQLDLSSLQYISKTKKMFSSCESFSTVTGNFVLCSNKFRVDFRGVRSISAMRSDWKLITGLNIDDVSTTLYLLVLKGCVGKAVAFHDRSSHDCCYLIQQTAQWCTGLLHFGDICDVIELDNIQWAKMPCLTSKTICDTTLKAKINVHISRKGGTVIRLVFSPPTSWDASIEQDVISDCNFLLDTLSHILNGKVAAQTMAFLPRVPPLCCPARPDYS